VFERLPDEIQRLEHTLGSFQLRPLERISCMLCNSSIPIQATSNVESTVLEHLLNTCSSGKHLDQMNTDVQTLQSAVDEARETKRPRLALDEQLKVSTLLKLTENPSQIV
jgi:hypothetical protein